MYVTTQQRRRRGLGSGASSSWAPAAPYDSAYQGYTGGDPAVPGSAAQLLMDTGSATGLDPLANCSWFDQLMFQWGIGNLSCMTPSANAAGAAQIQSVCENAKTAYGSNSPTALAACAMAKTQIAQVPGDTAVILESYNKTLPLPTFSIPWYLWAAGAVGLLLWVRR
jgi:hypothetical protein